ncbi:MULTISPECIES: hypothetical protein [Natrialbaceae]|uniref:hypothetical protein n=1 Tax=Natrialbaceae TaxID=1644061 RepID=UPI00207C265D|nr:hypothetical protein [Natronococcus sp. CG52]
MKQAAITAILDCAETFHEDLVKLNSEYAGADSVDRLEELNSDIRQMLESNDIEVGIYNE